MLKKILKAIGLLLVTLVAVGVILYAIGVRIELDGGGTPHLRMPESEAAQAERIARHREAQRTAPSPPAQAAPAVPAERVAPVETPAVAKADGGTRPAAVSPLADRPSAAPEWPDFRGPQRDGHYRARPIRTDWPSGGLQPLWKQPIGAGYASFVVAHGRAFTIEQRGEKEVVAAYEVGTGREVWINEWTAAFREFMGGDGPRATPTWAAGHVYALGAQGELRSLDERTGQMIWRTNVLDDTAATNLDWGMAASPLVVDDLVVVLPGGPDGRSVAAYDRRTGKLAWTALNDKASYASPMLATLAGVRQIVVFSGSRIVGITPDKGELLWEHPWKTPFDINAGQPLVVADNRVFVSSGNGTGAAVLELTPPGDGWSVREVWRNIRMKNQFTSSVLHDGFIYGLDEAILACVDAATGDLKWKGGRYGYGQVMLASGHLIVLTEGGELALVRATPESHQEIAKFAALEGKSWNHPAIAEGYLLIRNLKEMAAFDLRR